MGQKIKSLGSEGQDKSKALCLYVLKKFYMEPFDAPWIFMNSLTRDWRKQNMQQLPKEFVGRMVRTVLFIGLVAACCAGVATFGMLVASKFNLTTSRNQVPLTSVKIEG